VVLRGENVNLSDFQEGSFSGSNGFGNYRWSISWFCIQNSLVLMVMVQLYTEQVGEIADEPNYEAALWYFNFSLMEFQRPFTPRKIKSVSYAFKREL
jgi:hypothetical protein